ncbi:hypothetical protein ACFO4O_11045 [Glaciecola siphonariae]|uniref:Uncharacterized protein n=1 Tax=Glaciecola siphonariae TaxID=521012 RepID=A0ABV9LZ41_9ALTE
MSESCNKEYINSLDADILPSNYIHQLSHQQIFIHSIGDEESYLASAQVFARKISSATYKAKSLRNNLIFSISVAIHLLIILYFIYYQQTSDTLQTRTAAKDDAALKSYLYTTPPKAEPAPEIAKDIAGETDLGMTSERSEKLESPVLAEEQAQTIEPRTAPQKQILQNTSEQVTQADTLKLSQERLNNALKNYQLNQDQKAISRMAQEGARAYQDEKRSPQLNIPDMPEPERFAPRAIELDCANTGKKILSLVAGLGGGRVQCREHNNIQEFIDKRLHKGQEKDESNSHN